MTTKVLKGFIGCMLFVLGLVFYSCSPAAPQWKFKERVVIEAIHPYGVAWHDGELHCSSREGNMIIILNKDNRIVKRIDEYTSPMRLNTSGNSLIITEFEGNRVALRAGEETLFYPLVQRLDGPMAAAFLRNTIAIADYNKHRVVYYKGSENKTFGEEGPGKDQFSYPTDIQFHKDLIYIADNQNRRIQVYNDNAEFVRTIGNDSGLEQASGVFVDNGGVLVCDRKGKQVLWFDHNGQMLQKIDQGFEKPSDAIVVDSKMYVADEEGGCITILDLK
jgi:hypothetical protein